DPARGEHAAQCHWQSVEAAVARGVRGRCHGSIGRILMHEVHTELREIAQFIEQLETTMAAFPRVWERSPQETRQANRAGNGLFGPMVFSSRAHWKIVAGRSGPIRLRILLPSSGHIERVYYRIHGGGWVFGAPDGGEPALEA